MMKRVALYIAIISICASYVFGMSDRNVAADSRVRLVHVGRITSINVFDGSVNVKGVALAEDESRSNRAETKVLISESTPISYKGAAIGFLDLHVGDLIRATGSPSGPDMAADEIQKYK